MALHASLIKYPLIFKIPAGTSRGTLRQKTSYFIRVWESDGRFGIGECSLLPGLSIESESTAEKILNDICRRPEYYRERINDELSEYPSVRFGFETAIKDLQTGGAGCLFPSAFTDGADSIDINALVWMGDTDTMQKEAESKLNAGCRCIKLKIGALEFEAECRLIEFIRSHPLGKTVDIRLDANGAFRPEELSEKLDSLARFHIHSIEQPLPKGLSQCIPAKRPIPIALDEEIIGIRSVDEKKRLLDRIYPDFLVLKPGLLGGFAACREWINLCETHGIGWWITSALESNIGLSAIAQWAYTLFPKIPQGLGTGSLFINNIPAQTETVPEHRLFFRPHISRDFSSVGWLINRHSPKNEHREEFHKTRVTFFPGYAENPCITANAEKLSESPDVPLYIKEFDRMTRQWHNTEDYIEISTSGSTGIPKSVGILKKYITYSAQSTLDFLSVRRGAHFLLCLPPQFIGGMMVYVRAALCRGSLTVCPPNLIADSVLPGYYDVVSVTPYLLMKTPELTNSAGIMLIGGASVPQTLKEQIKTFPGRVYETFGMTETISHIALKDLKSGRNDFQVLPHVSVSTDSEGHLVIDAPAIGVSRLLTNDLIELTGKDSFRWLGRADDVINMGGLKLHPASIEERLAPYINSPFIIAALPDERLGQVPLLVLQTRGTDISQTAANLQSAQYALSKQESPRYVCFTDIPLFNERGKANRTAFRGRIPSVYAIPA